MKIKIDFVSNSSSSSFIIVDERINKSEPIRIELKIEATVRNFQHEKIENLKDFDESNHGCDIKEYDPEKYEEVKKSFENGSHIYFIDVSSEDFDNPISLVVYEDGPSDLKFSEGVKLLDNVTR